MKNKLKASSKFDERDINGDVTWLLREIRSISHQLEANVSLYDSVDEAKKPTTYIKKLQKTPILLI